MSIKSKRISEDMKFAISEIIRDEVSDPDVKLVTITSIDLTSDMSFAKVYFTSMTDNKELVEKALNHASSHIKTELGHRISFRKTPTLKFVFDSSIEYGKHIEDLIKEVI